MENQNYYYETKKKGGDYMKFIFTAVIAVLFMTATVGDVAAAPENENKAANNPQVVSYYPGPDDVHTIPGEEGQIHTGSDLVMKAGNSGVFQQWFLGTSDVEGKHGEHSVWMPAKDMGCPNGWLFMENPNDPPTGDTWGYHFPEDTDYCVKTNDYMNS